MVYIRVSLGLNQGVQNGGQKWLFQLLDIMPKVDKMNKSVQKSSKCHWGNVKHGKRNNTEKDLRMLFALFQDETKK